MQVLSLSSDIFAELRRPILTVGTFDGIHLAHRAILDEVISRARQVGGTSLVVTFEPHPQALLNPQKAPLLLTTQEEKLKILSSLGLDVVVLLPFNRDLAQMEAPAFVEQILHRRLRAWEVVIGHDHAFGRGRRGRLATLQDTGKRWGFKVDAVEPILHRNRPISSTRIRRRLLAGLVREAAEMLGRPYSLAGQIVAGDGRGRDLSYPTANLEVPSRKLIPANGVYAVASHFAVPALNGLLNVGLRPTFGGEARRVEVHFFDFQGSLYGQEISIQLIERIRDEEKFANSARLSEQIRRDEEVARRLLASK
jgi:riboflavin kinase/FMN adenylyltransferase